MILFVGDKPSSKNTDPNVAFVGTWSHEVLKAWFKELGVSEKEVHLINCSWYKIDWFLNYDRVVTLGNAADFFISKLRYTTKFKLPHPSGRNRLLNDKEFVRKKLSECREYLRFRPFKKLISWPPKDILYETNSFTINYFIRSSIEYVFARIANHQRDMRAVKDFYDKI